MIGRRPKTEQLMCVPAVSHPVLMIQCEDKNSMQFFSRLFCLPHRETGSLYDKK